MNDRYLFRGKRIDNDEWVMGGVGYDHQIDSPLIIIMSNRPKIVEFDIVPATLGQCTGLRDKNGELIFEGDIVSLNIGNNKAYEVGYKDEYCSFVLEGCEIGAVIAWRDCLEDLEVIGNVHDNPELLEESK